MIYISLVLALAVGYVIGLLQGGININHNKDVVGKNAEYNKSIGIEKYTDYYDKTEGMNNF